MKTKNRGAKAKISKIPPQSPSVTPNVLNRVRNLFTLQVAAEFSSHDQEQDLPIEGRNQSETSLAEKNGLDREHQDDNSRDADDGVDTDTSVAANGAQQHGTRNELKRRRDDAGKAQIYGTDQDIDNDAARGNTARMDGNSNDGIVASAKKHRALDLKKILSQDSLEADWTELHLRLCIKCDEGGELLICSDTFCPLAVHAKCMNCSAFIDHMGNFYCPYCSYKRAIAETCRAKDKENLARNMARKALLSFLATDMGSLACEGINILTGDGDNAAQVDDGQDNRVFVERVALGEGDQDGKVVGDCSEQIEGDEHRRVIDDNAVPAQGVQDTRVSEHGKQAEASFAHCTDNMPLREVIAPGGETSASMNRVVAERVAQVEGDQDGKVVGDCSDQIEVDEHRRVIDDNAVPAQGVQDTRVSEHGKQADAAFSHCTDNMSYREVIAPGGEISASMNRVVADRVAQGEGDQDGNVVGDCSEQIEGDERRRVIDDNTVQVQGVHDTRVSEHGKQAVASLVHCSDNMPYGEVMAPGGETSASMNKENIDEGKMSENHRLVRGQYLQEKSIKSKDGTVLTSEQDQVDDHQCEGDLERQHQQQADLSAALCSDEHSCGEEETDLDDETLNVLLTNRKQVKAKVVVKHQSKQGGGQLQAQTRETSASLTGGGNDVEHVGDHEHRGLMEDQSLEELSTACSDEDLPCGEDSTLISEVIGVSASKRRRKNENLVQEYPGMKEADQEMHAKANVEIEMSDVQPRVDPPNDSSHNPTTSGKKNVGNQDKGGNTSGKSRQHQGPSKHSPRPGFPSARRQKLRWKVEEEEMLREGVQKFSTGANKNVPWRRILEFGNRVFDKTRTPVDLKDKWRNLLKQS